MQIHIVSLFPEIFMSFLETSLIKKAQEKDILKFTLVNPRKYCTDKHQTVDDEIYGGGAGMLIKAEPIILAVEDIIKNNNIQKSDFSILFPTPSQETFNQKSAYGLAKKEHIIFICGRYEGIDYRVELFLKKNYPNEFKKISLGQFVLLGGEIASMTMIEAITRLIPGVIKESESRQEESYSLKTGMNNIEYPQYTRPEKVVGLSVPKVLLSGDEKAIQKRKEKNSENITKDKN